MPKFGFIFLFLGLPLFSQVTQPGQPAGKAPDQLPNTVQAPPFTVRDKFDFRVVQAFGLKGFAGAALGAAIGQADDIPHAWGQGVGGYADRYASSFASNVSRQVFAFGMEAAFHEDPRYFASEDKPFKQRALNALKQTVFTRTDNGGDSFAYARVISAFASGELVNAWQPRANASFGQGLRRGMITISADAGYNLLQEFFPFTRPISLRHRH